MEPAHQDKMAGLTKEDQNINNTAEDISNQASGHKANISNPSKCLFFWLNNKSNGDNVDTSQQSKEHSKQVLKELGGDKAFYGKQGQGE